MNVTAYPNYQGTPILTRAEAKAKLHTLTPGSEEYRQLESALIKALGIAEIILPNSSYKVNTSRHHLCGGFGACEHVAIGEEVTLREFAKNTPLLVKGAAEAKFQDIVALGGDFYGVAGAAISLPNGGTDGQKIRFLDAFKTLEQGNNDQLKKIMVEIDEESKHVRSSGLPHHCYSSTLIERNRKMNQIKGDINDLLIDNRDHFDEDAITAYNIGHQCAIEEARTAGLAKDLERLKRAYAMDAFACHFLTDLFASGHVRNQRGKLEDFLIKNLGFDLDVAKVLAGILTGAQHEKDGHAGLFVVNGKKDPWEAYGDGHYFSPENQENGPKAVAAVQQSVDEISDAYRYPTTKLQSSVSDHIPRASSCNPDPLYFFENNQLVLNQNGQKIIVKNKLDFLEAFKLALNNLPEDYVNGMINEMVADYTKKKLAILFNWDIAKPFYSLLFTLADISIKIIRPQIDNLTHVVWRTFGLASYSLTKKMSDELNAQTRELAKKGEAISNYTKEILQKITNMESQLDLVEWDITSRGLFEAMNTIETKILEYDTYKKSLNPTQKKEIEKALWNAHVDMTKIISRGTVKKQNILVAYRKMLEKDKSRSNTSISVLVNEWFSDLLKYQVRAISRYSELVIERGGRDELPAMIPEFESNLLNQFAVNEEHLVKRLVFNLPLPIAVFGAAEWRKYIGEVGDEPLLPLDILEILNAPCPFWPNKKICETHILCLVPETVNGRPLDLKYLNELIQKPLQGFAAKCFINLNNNYNDPKAPKSRWVLLTRDVIEGSRKKTLMDQQALIANYSQASNMPYKAPTVLATNVCILMEYIRTGIRLFGENPKTTTRCEYDQLMTSTRLGAKLTMHVQTGQFGDALNLSYIHQSEAKDYCGMAAMMELEAK